jgi:hypothetical protein
MLSQVCLSVAVALVCLSSVAQSVPHGADAPSDIDAANLPTAPFKHTHPRVPPKGFINVWVTVTPRAANASIPLPRAVFIPHVPLNATIKQFRDLSVLSILNTLFGLMVQNIQIPEINYLRPIGPGEKDHARVPVLDHSKTLAEVVDASDLEDSEVEFEDTVDLSEFLAKLGQDPFFSGATGIPAGFPDNTLPTTTTQQPMLS